MSCQQCIISDGASSYLQMAMDWQTLVPFQVRAGTWPQGIIGFISFQGAGSVQGSATRSSSYLALGKLIKFRNSHFFHLHT